MQNLYNVQVISAMIVQGYKFVKDLHDGGGGVQNLHRGVQNLRVRAPHRLSESISQYSLCGLSTTTPTDHIIPTSKLQFCNISHDICPIPQNPADSHSSFGVWRAKKALSDVGGSLLYKFSHDFQFGRVLPIYTKSNFQFFQVLKERRGITL